MSCESRHSYEADIAWTWQDGRLLALALTSLGILGAFLNGLVLVGVRGNVRLGTTVNKLLIWICTMAGCEATFGILMKSLILAQVIQKSVSKHWNLIVCKLVICLPFILCNTILVLWSLISCYRLHLVNRAANKRRLKAKKEARASSNFGCGFCCMERKKHSDCCCKPQLLLPSLGLFIGAAVGGAMAAFSDPFVLLRECRGNCLGPDEKFEEWKAALTMVVSGCVFHVPSSMCYLFIFCIVKRHQREQKRSKLAMSVASPGAMAIQMTLLTSRAGDHETVPKIKFASHAEELESDNIDFAEVERIRKQRRKTLPNMIRRMSTSVMATLQVPRERYGRNKRGNPGKSSSMAENTSDLYDPSSREHEDSSYSSISRNGAAKIRGLGPPSRRQSAATSEKRFSGEKTPPNVGLCCCWKSSPSGLQPTIIIEMDEKENPPPSVTLNGKSMIASSIEEDESSLNARCRHIRRRLARNDEDSVTMSPEPSVLSIIQRSRAHRRSSAISSQLSKIRTNKRRRRNIISAKLSVAFILLSILMGILLHFGYTRVDLILGSRGDTLTLRAFINALAFDVVLVVISPLMLLYSSKDLRKSIKAKFNKTRGQN